MAVPLARRKKRRIEQQPLERLAARILEHQHNPIDESQLTRRLRAALRS